MDRKLLFAFSQKGSYRGCVFNQQAMQRGSNRGFMRLIHYGGHTKHILKTVTQRDAFFEKEKGVLTDRVTVLK